MRLVHGSVRVVPLVALLLLANCTFVSYAKLEQKYQQMQQQLQSEINADQVKITQLEGELKVTFKD